MKIVKKKHCKYVPHQIHHVFSQPLVSYLGSDHVIRTVAAMVGKVFIRFIGFQGQTCDHLSPPVARLMSEPLVCRDTKPTIFGKQAKESILQKWSTFGPCDFGERNEAWQLYGCWSSMLSAHGDKGLGWWVDKLQKQSRGPMFSEVAGSVSWYFP